MNGGNSSVVLVASWQVSGARYFPLALVRPCWRMRPNEAKGLYQTATRTVRSEVAMNGTKREVVARSALGRWPNNPFHRIAALLRFGITVKGHVWAARGDRGR